MCIIRKTGPLEFKYRVRPIITESYWLEVIPIPYHGSPIYVDMEIRSFVWVFGPW